MSSPYTIPLLNMIFMLASGIIAIAFPILLARYLLVKKKVKINGFFVGGLIFIVFALIMEGFVNNTLLTKLGSFSDNIVQNIWLYAIYGGLAAGIFEEFGRLVGFKLLLKKEKSRETALMYGVGHGGTEAIILVGLTMIGYFVVSIFINMDILSRFIPDESTLIATYDSFRAISESSSPVFLISGLERVFAICLQIALSVIVFQAIMTKGKGYLFFIAILIHAFVDFVAVILMNYIDMILVETAVFVMTVAVSFFAYKLYTGMNVKAPDNTLVNDAVEPIQET